MPDITMCSGGDCPRKNNCFRHIATPDELQSYFVNPPYDAEGCAYFFYTTTAPVPASEDSTSCNRLNV